MDQKWLDKVLTKRISTSHPHKDFGSARGPFRGCRSQIRFTRACVHAGCCAVHPLEAGASELHKLPAAINLRSPTDQLVGRGWDLDHHRATSADRACALALHSMASRKES
jgi:hypothetical protein